MITKNINPLSLERKIQEQNTREMIYVLNNEFYKRICKSKNFIYLYSKNVLHSKTSETVMEYTLKKMRKTKKKLKRTLFRIKAFFSMFTQNVIQKSILCQKKEE